MIKGAFKEFPEDKQPERIPLTKYDELSQWVKTQLEGFGQIFIPSIKKITRKPDTGDLDIFVDPNDRLNWRTNLNIILNPSIVSQKSNGPQQMYVLKNRTDDKQYMFDFILCDYGSFDYRKMYSKFGTIIPAVVGSFARCLRYKFDQNALYLRLMSKKGNYHNIKLTNDFETAMNILMLDMGPVDSDDLYDAESVANWIISSPRFDCNIWNKPPDAKGQTIVTKNVKSHRAAKGREEVKLCYSIVDSSIKKQEWDNSGYKIERQLLGDQYVDDILSKIEMIERKQEKIISGKEIIDMTGLTEGAEIGKIIRHIENSNFDREQAIDYIRRNYGIHGIE